MSAACGGWLHEVPAGAGPGPHSHVVVGRVGRQHGRRVRVRPVGAVRAVRVRAVRRVRPVQAGGGPVARPARRQPARRAPEELGAVPQRAAREGRAPAARHEVPVAAAVQLLVGGHAQAHHQVQLAARQHRHPEQVEGRVEHDPCHPGVAGRPVQHRAQCARALACRALGREVTRAAPQHPHAHHQQAAQEPDEINVVLGAYKRE